MKSLVLILALSLSTFSANAADLDVTTCNPALLARLNQMSSLTKEQRKGIEQVNSIMYYKMNVVKDMAKQIIPLSDAASKAGEAAKRSGNSIGGLADSAISAGKISAYTEVLKIIKADLDNLNTCYNRTNELLYGKK